MRFTKRISLLLGLTGAVCLGANPPEKAPSIDPSKAMAVKADSWEMDGKKNIRQMSGNIVAKYGPLSLKADTLTEKTRSEQKVLFATGNPVVIETYDEMTQRQITAVARQIEYHIQTKTLHLTSNAEIRITQGKQELLIKGKLVQLTHNDRVITKMHAQGTPVEFKQSTPENTIEATAKTLTMDELTGIITMQNGHMQRGVDQFSFPFLRYNTRTGDLEATADENKRPELHFSGNHDEKNP